MLALRFFLVLLFLFCLRTGVLECLDDASLHLDFTFVSSVSGHPRPPVVTAPWVSLLGPTGVPPMSMQDGIGCRAPTLVVALCRWWWTCHVDVARTRLRQAHLVDSRGHAVVLASRSLMRVSSTALRHIRELEIVVVVECLSIVSVLCCVTHHMLELNRLNEICVPFQVFVSTFPTSHSLMMSCISSLSSFELVLEFFLCMLSSVEFLM